MVSKAVPIGIVILLAVAALIGFMIVTGGQVQVGPPFDIPYEECVSAAGEIGLFTKAVRSSSSAPCAQMVSSMFCEAIIAKDESLCGDDQTCIAFVREDPEKCLDEDHTCRAFIMGDVSLCDKISLEEFDTREECKALVRGDHRYFTSRQSKRDCRDAVVHVLATDASMCDQVSDREVRESCRSRFEVS